MKPKTVRFILQRPSPHRSSRRLWSGPKFPKKMKSPIKTSVVLPAEIASSEGWVKGEPLLQLTEREAIRIIRLHGGNPKEYGTRVFVCFHMGRFA